MNPMKYELIICEINNRQLFFNGIKIDTKQEIKRINHSGSYDPIGFVTSDRTVDFTLTDPKDADMINILYNSWVDTHMPFYMALLSKNIGTGAWDLVAALDGCVLNKVDHNLKAKEEWKPGASGMALKFTRMNYQFDPNTGNLLSPAKDVISAASSKLSHASSILTEVGTSAKRLGIA